MKRTRVVQLSLLLLLAVAAQACCARLEPRERVISTAGEASSSFSFARGLKMLQGLPPAQQSAPGPDHSMLMAAVHAALAPASSHRVDTSAVRPEPSVEAPSPVGSSPGGRRFMMPSMPPVTHSHTSLREDAPGPVDYESRHRVGRLNQGQFTLVINAAGIVIYAFVVWYLFYYRKTKDDIQVGRPPNQPAKEEGPSVELHVIPPAPAEASMPAASAAGPSTLQ